MAKSEYDKEPLSRVEEILKKGGGGGGGGGTNDYDDLINKPSINGITLEGDKTGEELKLVNQSNHLTPSEINDLVDLLNS